MFRLWNEGTPFGIAVLAGILVTGFALPVAAEDGPELSIGSIALNVAEFERSEKFYADVLGFIRVGTYPPAGQGEPIEVFLQRPGSSGGASLILAHVNDDPLPEGKSRYGRIIVNTPEAKVIEKRAQAAGAKTREIKIPGDNPPTIIFFNDPDGYEIELYQAPK